MTTPKRRFRYFNEILKENNYPFAWYLQREPRKIIIGPKGFGDGKDWFEIGLVTCGVGYGVETKNNPPQPDGTGTPGESTYYALACEGISIAKKLGLSFTMSEVENKIPVQLVPNFDARAFVEIETNG